MGIAQVDKSHQFVLPIFYDNLKGLLYVYNKADFIISFVNVIFF